MQDLAVNNKLLKSIEDEFLRAFTCQNTRKVCSPEGRG